jgi:hypothetical protein
MSRDFFVMRLCIELSIRSRMQSARLMSFVSISIKKALLGEAFTTLLFSDPCMLLPSVGVGYESQAAPYAAIVKGLIT